MIEILNFVEKCIFKTEELRSRVTRVTLLTLTLHNGKMSLQYFDKVSRIPYIL